VLSLGGVVRVEDEGLAAVLRRAGNLTPLFAGPIDKSVTLMFERRFASEGAWGGIRWAGHQPLTIRLRARPGHGRGGILRDTSRLWASFVKGSGPDAVRRITPSEYERGSAVPYARFHQRGYSLTRVFGIRLRKPRRVPARPVVPERVPREVLATWERLVKEYVERGAR
jgi:hypothetical protein